MESGSRFMYLGSIRLYFRGGSVAGAPIAFPSMSRLWNMRTGSRADEEGRASASTRQQQQTSCRVRNRPWQLVHEEQAPSRARPPRDRLYICRLSGCMTYNFDGLRLDRITSLPRSANGMCSKDRKLKLDMLAHVCAGQRKIPEPKLILCVLVKQLK